MGYFVYLTLKENILNAFVFQNRKVFSIKSNVPQKCGVLFSSTMLGGASLQGCHDVTWWFGTGELRRPRFWTFRRHQGFLSESLKEPLGAIQDSLHTATTALAI